MLFSGAFIETGGVTEDSAAWWLIRKKPFTARIAIPAIKRPATSQRKACFLGLTFGDCTAIWSSADRNSFELRGDSEVIASFTLGRAFCSSPGLWERLLASFSSRTSNNAIIGAGTFSNFPVGGAAR